MDRSNKKKIIFSGVAAAFVGIMLYLLLSVQGPSRPVVTKPVSRRVSRAIQYPKAIKGKIITLKILTLEDAFDYHEMFSDKVRKFMEFPKKLTFGELEYQIRKELKDMQANKLVVYTIWDNVDNRLAGAIQIREKDPNHPGQLAMWLNENYWGGGRIQEAMFLISDAYFKANPKIDSYNAHVRLWNPRSIKSMEKFGFKKIGDYIEDGKVARYIFELSRETIESKK